MIEELTTIKYQSNNRTESEKTKENYGKDTRVNCSSHVIWGNQKDILLTLKRIAKEVQSSLPSVMFSHVFPVITMNSKIKNKNKYTCSEGEGALDIYPW